MMKLLTTVAVLILTAGVIGSDALADSRDWTLQSTKGEKFTLSEHLGDKPLVLLFWATWCTPCKKELDEQKELFNSLAAEGVHVLLISEDNQKSMAKVKPFVESKGYTWPALHDPDGEVLKRYGGINLPYTVVLDADGNVQSKLRTAIKDANQFRSLVTGLMD